MADEEDRTQTSANQIKKTRKRTGDTEIEVQAKNSDVLECLQEISKLFGVGGLYSNKKRKIETHKETLAVLDGEWFNLDLIENLSGEEKKRFAEEMSPITIKNLVNLGQMIAFFNRISNSSKVRKQVKDYAMDHLLKDILTNPLLPIPERYCEMSLWKQIMHINQQVWKSMESLEKETEGSDSCVEDNMSDVEAEGSRLTKGPVEKPKKNFRDFYMDMVTASFADDLDELRKDPSFDHKKISMLIDCLETGKDIWSDVEKELLQSHCKT